jgi:16S rRNA (cytidine1402-2'-O)-methyltransferase
LSASFARTLAQPLAPGLYIVATPIGHLADITVRALAVLAQVEHIYCEDTRHSRKLLDAYALRTRLSPYHEHNAVAVRPRILQALAGGARIALISDAGTPLVSDPGYKLVRAALDAGQRVTAVPGPSAVMAALTVAGLPTDSFHFAGFLPAKSTGRRRRLADLAAIPATVVLFEAPGRVADLMADVAAVLGPSRPVVLARELTKLHETVQAGAAGDIAARLAAEPPRGECVVLIAPPEPAAGPGAVDAGALDAALLAALQTASASAAAKAVADRFGLSKSDVYARVLALKAGGKPAP